MRHVYLLLLITLFFVSCSDDNVTNSSNKENLDPKFTLQDSGLYFYSSPHSSSSYKLEQLTDYEFNKLNKVQKRVLADKLLSTMFFAYSNTELQNMFDRQNFLDTIKTSIKTKQNNVEHIESFISDETKFRHDRTGYQMQDILARFFAMDKLDSYFYKNWMAYVLTQTIMFSPAYELDTTHLPNVSRVYNYLVKSLIDQNSMRFTTYVHMMSEDNWRRFRSPEDNGREMLEIFTLDAEDSHVPLSAQALQNWKLSRDSDTLEISLNQNKKPIKLFNTTLRTGVEFYAELVKSKAFIVGVSTRLVDYFFYTYTKEKKQKIINSIVESKPENFEDIFTQIIFSKEYLLNNEQIKSAEELYFSLVKKIHYRVNSNSFYGLTSNLEKMHQAIMKYKLGKSTRVPLDSLSFIIYHKFIRESVLYRKTRESDIDNFQSYHREGWSEEFLDTKNFKITEGDDVKTLKSFINYIFNTLIARDVNNGEFEVFKKHFLDDQDKFIYNFNMLVKYDDPDREIEKRTIRRVYITYIIFDYISRLDTLYIHSKVK